MIVTVASKVLSLSLLEIIVGMSCSSGFIIRNFRIFINYSIPHKIIKWEGLIASKENGFVEIAFLFNSHIFLCLLASLIVFKSPFCSVGTRTVMPGGIRYSPHAY